VKSDKSTTTSRLRGPRKGEKTKMGPQSKRTRISPSTALQLVSQRKRTSGISSKQRKARSGGTIAAISTKVEDQESSLSAPMARQESALPVPTRLQSRSPSALRNKEHESLRSNGLNYTTAALCADTPGLRGTHKEIFNLMTKVATMAFAKGNLREMIAAGAIAERAATNGAKVNSPRLVRSQGRLP